MERPRNDGPFHLAGVAPEGGEMRLRRLKKYGIGADGMLVLVMAILLATGWGSARSRPRSATSL
jgi:hypothetical protein